MPAKIVTLTLNPAVDLASTADKVVPTHKNRTFDERLDAGGGGINVARVIRILGGDVLALIMTGGVTGRLIEELLDEAQVPWRALPIRGRTRISLNVHDRQSGLEYRFVPAGPEVAEHEWRRALATLQEVSADWIVASGSLPRGIPADFYARAAAITSQRGQKFVLDTSGPALKAAVGRGIELLKLSVSELESLLGRKLADPESREQEAAALVHSGAARLIAVSLGREGAILADAEGVIRLPGLAVREMSAVGAGDSFLAGLVLGLARGLPRRDALAMGIATGAAAVTTYGTAQVARDRAEALFQQARREADDEPDRGLGHACRGYPAEAEQGKP